MYAFLAVFFSVYSAIHAFCYFRLRVLLPQAPTFRLVFILFLVLMVVMPMAGWFLEQNGYDEPARISALIGYTWMGFILFILWFGLLLTLVDGAVYLFNSAFSIHLPRLNGRAPTAVLLVTVILICCYATFESFQLQVDHIKIPTPKLPAGVERLRIVQVSDIHLGLMAREKRLQTILQKVAEQKPDIMVSTGDLLDGSADNIEGLARMFDQIQPPCGKYAVTGNHELYAGLKDAIAFHQNAGLTLLRGEIHTIPGLINIAGMDDHHIPGSRDEAALLASKPNRLFTLFLKHQPIIDPNTLGLFDLQLSGHTHGGQIFFYNPVIARSYPYLKGYFELSKGSKLYVNRGTGTWGPQMRILTPPEITVIDLTRQIP